LTSVDKKPRGRKYMGGFQEVVLWVLKVILVDIWSINICL